MWELDHKEVWAPKNWCVWTVVLEKTLESPLDCKEIQPVNKILTEINTDCSLEALMLSWSCNALATWCEELTHWKMPWCWETLQAGGEGDDRGWGGWMASSIWWTWAWASSRRWWRTGKPGVLQSMGSQRVRHDWMTEQQQHISENFKKINNINTNIENLHHSWSFQVPHSPKVHSLGNKI